MAEVLSAEKRRYHHRTADVHSRAYREKNHRYRIGRAYRRERVVVDTPPRYHAVGDVVHLLEDYAHQQRNREFQQYRRDRALGHVLDHIIISVKKPGSDCFCGASRRAFKIIGLH